MCDKKEETIPEVVVAGDKTEYLTLLPETAHDMTVTKQSGESHFLLVTTSGDPYVLTGALKKSLSADSAVLCFEYKSNKDLSFMQLFFAAPISEERSVKTSLVPASPSWKEFRVVLKKALAKNSWGSAGGYLRLDFGDEKGCEIEIQKIHFSAMTPEEKESEKEEEEKIEADKQFGESLITYLNTDFSSSLTEVTVDINQIRIQGNCVGDGNFVLAEVPVYKNVTQTNTWDWTTPISVSAFSINVDRFIDRNGIRYDRALSKWLILKKGTTESAYSMASHARYADRLYSIRTTTREKPLNKKGLGGCINNLLQRQDWDDLGISSATVNVPVTAFMWSRPGGNRVEHVYGGKSYYFDQDYLNGLDITLSECQKRHIVVSAILLIQPADDCPDPVIGNLLQYPDYSGGYYTMPNLTTPEGVNAYAAALDFLAERYCRDNGPYGRIHHWIMHNEVDAGIEWTNMGQNKPLAVYVDTYLKSMRLCYNIVRQYDGYSEVLASFTHSWKKKSGTADAYATLDMLDLFNAYDAAEGDFQWGLAYHCYPQNLNEPKTWNDAEATYSSLSPYITFKNLEVLDYWAKQPANQYKGKEKRTIWLSENGTNSKSYEAQDLAEQAAGFAWGWKKLGKLEGIDAMQWHNWADNEGEFGLRIGLRKFSSYGYEPKDVWYVYQAAGTSKEDDVFFKYLSVIGISDWDILKNVY